jgi:hypothetical protein
LLNKRRGVEIAVPRPFASASRARVHPLARLSEKGAGLDIASIERFKDEPSAGSGANVKSKGLANACKQVEGSKYRAQLVVRSGSETATNRQRSGLSKKGLKESEGFSTVKERLATGTNRKLKTFIRGHEGSVNERMCQVGRRALGLVVGRLDGSAAGGGCHVKTPRGSPYPTTKQPLEGREGRLVPPLCKKVAADGGVASFQAFSFSQVAAKGNPRWEIENDRKASRSNPSAEGTAAKVEMAVWPNGLSELSGRRD